jgi:hypothetical protein
LGIIYKLLEGSRGDGKKVVRKKDKKISKKSLKKSLLKKFESITNCRREGSGGELREGGRVENCHSNA